MEFLKRRLNKGIMQNILDSFTDLTDIRVAYFEDSTESITGREKDICKFCSIAREFPVLYKRCMACDRNALKTAQNIKGIYLYRCHMGLWEAVVPIYVRKIQAGFLMLGQVKGNDKTKEKWEETKKELKLLEIPDDKVKELDRVYNNMKPVSKRKIKAAADMLDMMAKYIVDADIIHIYDMEAVEKAKKYINDNFNKNVSTSLLSKIVGLSSSYLSFLFKRETGLTITEYIIVTRLNHAKDMLITTSMSVKEIAEKIGYDDQNYLSRIFKRHEGIRPVNFRKKNKK
jgi:AraC-like DNA-binding protein